MRTGRSVASPCLGEPADQEVRWTQAQGVDESRCVEDWAARAAEFREMNDVSLSRLIVFALWNDQSHEGGIEVDVPNSQVEKLVQPEETCETEYANYDKAEVNEVVEEVRFDQIPKHRSCERLLLLGSGIIREPDGAVESQLDEGKICWRREAGDDVSPTDTVHGVCDAAPSSICGQQIVEVHRDIEWIRWDRRETGEAPAEGFPLDPGSFVFSLRAGCATRKQQVGDGAHESLQLRVACFSFRQCSIVF